jgi:putative phosphoribosyl transferase
MSGRTKFAQMSQEISVGVGGRAEICGYLNLVEGSECVVVMAHGSGSGRLNSRNCNIAEVFNRSGYSTVHVDLLTSDEERMDLETGEYRFNIDLLAMRTKFVTKWLMQCEETCNKKVVYFATNAAAAGVLSAAADMHKTVEAVISLGGRCDLLGFELPLVKAPTLFVVGENDNFITSVTHNAMGRMLASKKLIVIEGAGHLFEEPGAIEEVADISQKWLTDVLGCNT